MCVCGPFTVEAVCGVWCAGAAGRVPSAVLVAAARAAPARLLYLPLPLAPAQPHSHSTHLAATFGHFNIAILVYILCEAESGCGYVTEISFPFLLLHGKNKNVS